MDEIYNWLNFGYFLKLLNYNFFRFLFLMMVTLSLSTDIISIIAFDIQTY